MSVMDWLPRAELAVVLPTLLAIAASLFAYFIGKLWRARTFFRLLQKRGVVWDLQFSLVWDEYADSR